MDKVIVFSGHGGWNPSDGFTQLPGKCQIKYYTMNAKCLSDGLGGDIDRGRVAGLEPDQEDGAFCTTPNMRLYPPHGLHIRKPSGNWHTLTYNSAVPSDDKNIQLTIQDRFKDGVTLEKLIEYLDSALIGFDVTFLWAACRALGLKETPFGQAIGVNACQR